MKVDSSMDFNRASFSRTFDEPDARKPTSKLRNRASMAHIEVVLPTLRSPTINGMEDSQKIAIYQENANGNSNGLSLDESFEQALGNFKIMVQTKNLLF